MSALEVDPRGLEQGGAAVEEVAASIEIVRDDYLDKITSYHGCWGDGEFGETFAEKYLTGVEYARTGIKELSAALSGSAQSLLDAAERFRGQQSNILEHIQNPGGRQR